MKLTNVLAAPVAILVASMCACTPDPVVPVAPQPTVETKQTVDIDRTLLAQCEPMHQLQNKSYTKAQVLEVIADWSNQYSECSLRQSNLSKLVSKAFNINDVVGTNTTQTQDTPSGSK